MWFQVISSSKINLEKSELILVGRIANIKDLAIVLGWRVGNLPTNHLGLLLGPLFRILEFGM